MLVLILSLSDGSTNSYTKKVQTLHILCQVCNNLYNPMVKPALRVRLQ